MKKLLKNRLEQKYIYPWMIGRHYFKSLEMKILKLPKSIHKFNKTYHKTSFSSWTRKI